MFFLNVEAQVHIRSCTFSAKDEKLIAPVIHAPSSVQVKYYFEGRLTCNVTGDPTPTVIWKHNSVRVREQLCDSSTVCNRLSFLLSFGV